MTDVVKYFFTIYINLIEFIINFRYNNPFFLFCHFFFTFPIFIQLLLSSIKSHIRQRKGCDILTSILGKKKYVFLIVLHQAYIIQDDLSFLPRPSVGIISPVSPFSLPIKVLLERFYFLSLSQYTLDSHT